MGTNVEVKTVEINAQTDLTKLGSDQIELWMTKHHCPHLEGHESEEALWQKVSATLAMIKNSEGV